MKVLLRVFFFFFFVAAATSVFSQFSIGPRGGIHYATWVVENGDNGFRTGLVTGAVAEIRINKVIAFQGEIDYIQKGYRYSQRVLGSDYEEKALLNYLEIPLLFKVGGGGRVRFDGMVGLGLGMALNGTYSIRDFGLEFERDINFVDDGVNRAELSFNLGAALSARIIDPLSVFADARYVQGLGSVYDLNSPTTLNTGFSLSLGVLFHLGKKEE